MTSIRSLGQSITSAFENAQEKAKNVGSSVAQNVAGLAGRLPGKGGAAPRQKLGTSLKASISHIKESAAEVKSDIKAFGAESRAALNAVKPDLSGLKSAASELKQDMKAFGQYLRHGDAESDAALDALKKGLASALTGAAPQGAGTKASSPDRLAALKTLHLPDTLSPTHVQGLMKSEAGREQLTAELAQFTQLVGEKTDRRLNNAWRESNIQKINAAAEQVLGELSDVRSQLEVFRNADVSPSTRKACLGRMGMESSMSLSYLEANATTPEGVSRMRGELATFEKLLKRAHHKGHLTLHPDKVMQRQGGAVGSAQFERKQQEASEAFDKFEKSSTILRNMAQGLGARLDQIEKGFERT